jgi:hypothetical protein
MRRAILIRKVNFYMFVKGRTFDAPVLKPPDGGQFITAI